MPKVSVIIPTYNHDQFVVEAIDSVLAQSFRDFELIVVNDGSTDHTEEALVQYIENGRIRYIKQENQGVAVARNHGLSLAVGEYIAFLDDDDSWPPDKLAWQVECLDECDAVMIGGSCYSDEKKHLDATVQVNEIRQLSDRDLFKRNPFSSPGQTLLRRGALEAIGGFDPKIWGADDLDLWIRLLGEGPLLISPKPALFYRIHPFNASKDALRMAKNLKKVFEQNLGRFASSRQPELERLGHRFIFRYCGRRMIWEAIENLLGGKFAQAQPMLRYCILNYLPRCPRDPLFFIYIASAICKRGPKHRA